MAPRAASYPVAPTVLPDPLDSREAQLLVIARRLFSERGFEATSLRDIAEAAKITKAALYYYFPNKDALYERVVVEALQSLLEAVGAEVQRVANPVDRIRAFMRSSADFLEHRREEWIAGSNAFWQGGQTDRRAVALHLRDSYEKLLRDCIVQGVQSGELRPVDAAMTGRFLLSALAHLPRWHRPGGKAGAHEVMDQFLEMALFGIASPAAAAAKAATPPPAKRAARRTA